jgi:Ca2+-dependent lipid-binding protein
VFDRE